MSDRKLDTLERARGCWLEILPRLGIDRAFLINKKGPCPSCGGKDRFRFDNKEGSGSFICNQCGAGGSGILLVRRMRDWSHKEACDAVDEIIGGGEIDLPVYRVPTEPKDDADRKRRAIRRALDECDDSSVATAYLKKRGIGVTSSILRGQHRCPYFGPDRKVIGRFPALIAPIHGADGQLESVHRIYDADVDPRKKTMPPVTTIKGGAVRLFECDEELAVAEGIETSLAVHEMFGVPIWSCLTAGGIEAFEPPKGLLRLQIYGDNDASMTGQSAAYALAKRALKADIAVEVHIPPQVGRDWLDVLNEQKGGTE
jgi:putative DNA primase/helicase